MSINVALFQVSVDSSLEYTSIGHIIFKWIKFVLEQLGYDGSISGFRSHPVCLNENHPLLPDLTPTHQHTALEKMTCYIKLDYGTE